MNLMYNGMMELVAKNEAFYFTDYERFGNTYRVFNYRLASYTDFLEPYALEMRGITFLININEEENKDDFWYNQWKEQGKNPFVVSRPFAKFFNLDENPMTMNLDLSQATQYEEKADGSLIATYKDDIVGKFGLKSKQAFFSEQATMAEEFLNLPENKILKDELEFFSGDCWTVLMELCSPANRIVLEYPTTHLKVHGIRHNITGKYFPKTKLRSDSALFKAWVNQVEVEGLPNDFKASTEALEGIEGYVVHGPWGRFKLKTLWYQNLHHLKDSISSEKKLIEAIIYERVDDVKGLFKTDTFTLNRIKEMENKIIPKFNHIIKTTEDFYLANKDLGRKDFAIKGQAEIKEYFHLAMNKYLQKEVDYKEFAMKYTKELFGVDSTQEIIQE